MILVLYFRFWSTYRADEENEGIWELFMHLILYIFPQYVLLFLKPPFRIG